MQLQVRRRVQPVERAALLLLDHLQSREAKEDLLGEPGKRKKV